MGAAGRMFWTMQKTLDTREKNMLRTMNARALSFFVLFLSVVVTAVHAQDPEKTFKRSEEPPAISTDKKIIDFGELISGELGTKKLTITNKGKGDLVLLKVSFTCGCTIPQIILPSGEIVVPDKKGDKVLGTLKGGEKAELDLEFRALGYNGEIKRMLTIHTNDPQHRETDVGVMAVVRPAFDFEPRRISFGDVPKGHGAEQTLLIRSIRAGAFKINSFDGLPPYLTYRVEPFMEGETHCARLNMELSKEAPVGLQNLKLRAHVESERIKEFNLYLMLNVQPPVTFRVDGDTSKAVLDFGILPKKTGAAKEIEIINDNPEVPYVIQELKFTSRHKEFIETELVTLEKGNHYKVKVTVKPEIEARFFRGTITLMSEHPDLRKKEISLKGWISKD
jgi:hypothetical protein